jgi:two-component system, LuxR family, sensor kinase FixL
VIPDGISLSKAGPFRTESGSDNDRRFQFVVEAAPNAMVMVDGEGLIVLVNAKTEQVFEYSRAELLGRPIEMLVPDRFRGRHPGLRASFFKNPVARPMGAGRDLYGRKRNGSEFPIEIGLNPIDTDEGPMVLSAIIDITERKAAEFSLRESEHRSRSLAAIVESSDDAIISNDLEGAVTSWNKSAERIFGYTADEMVGQSILRLAASGAGDEMIEILNRIKRGQRVDHYETKRRRRDGSTVYVSLTVSPIRDIADKLVGASKVARDITASTLANAALRDSQARLQELNSELLHVSRLSAMGEMASALAHELNQPLAAISNYMKGSRRLLAASPAANVSQIEAALDKAAEQAIRAGQIIRRLRDFVARAESERSIESVARLAEEAAALGLIGARERGVSLKFALEPEIDLVFVDRVQIQQVLVNLFRNAAEATAETAMREIKVSDARVAGDMIEIVVSDTGMGLTETVLSNLFKPFYTTKETGMGVGLSISRSIVEAHGGRMRAERNEAGGATFRLTLPAAPREALIDG